MISPRSATSAPCTGRPGATGVAVLSRTSLAEVAGGLPGDPVPDRARVLSVTAAGLRVVSVYVVNGKAVGAPEYELKLAWLDAFATGAAISGAEPRSAARRSRAACGSARGRAGR